MVLLLIMKHYAHVNIFKPPGKQWFAFCCEIEIDIYFIFANSTILQKSSKKLILRSLAPFARQ